MSEQKPQFCYIVIKMDLYQRQKKMACTACEAPCAADFNKIVDLKKSGLVIYVHNNVRKPTSPQRYKQGAESYIVHNTRDEDLKRDDYLNELDQYGSKCMRCKYLLQSAGKLLEDWSILKRNEIFGICTHCRRKSSEITCPKCEYTLKRFLKNKMCLDETRTDRVRMWLTRFRELLETIFAGLYPGKRIPDENIEAELQKFLSEFRMPQTSRDPDIDTLLPTDVKDILSGAIFSGDDHELLGTVMSELEKKDSIDAVLPKKRTDEKQTTEKKIFSPTKYKRPRSKSATETKSKTEESIVSRKKRHTNVAEKMPKSKEIPIVKESEIPKESVKSKDTKVKQLKDKEPKVIETKIKESKVKEPKVKEPKNKELKVEEPKDKDVKVKEPKVKESKMKEPKVKEPKVHPPKEPKELGPIKKEPPKPIERDVGKTKNEDKLTKQEQEKGKEKSKEDKGKDKIDSISSVSKTDMTKSSKDPKIKKNDHAQKEKMAGTADTAKISKKDDTESDTSKNKKDKISPEDLLYLKLLKEELARAKSERQPKPAPVITVTEIPRLPSPKTHVPLPTPPASLSILECSEPTLTNTREMILGNKIVPFRKRQDTLEKKKRKPIQFEAVYECTDIVETVAKSFSPNTNTTSTSRSLDKDGKKKEKSQDTVKNMGVVRYALSDRRFIDKGWTRLPTEKVMRRINVYRLIPARSESDWFARHKQFSKLFYDTGEKLAEIDDDGYGRWYYRNGGLALAYFNDEENNIGHRYVVSSNGEHDGFGPNKPVITLATFDHLGNAIIYNHSGNVRLKYNQSEGFVYDRTIGPPGRWKWHTLNEPPILQRVLVDTHPKCPDPYIEKLIKFAQAPKLVQSLSSTEDNMMAIEFENSLKRNKGKIMHSYKPYLKMKALKINKYFSLKILDQANISLVYRDGRNCMKLNMGMILIDNEIVDTATTEVSVPVSSYEYLYCVRRTCLKNICSKNLRNHRTY